MSPLTEAQVLVPVLLPDPDPLPEPLQGLLAGLDVMVPGIYEVRRQTAVEQARDQFGEEAEEALERWLRPLRERGSRLESRLVFSQTPMDTTERVAAEQRVDAILVPRPLGEEETGQIVLPVRGEPHAAAGPRRAVSRRGGGRASRDRLNGRCPRPELGAHRP